MKIFSLTQIYTYRGHLYHMGFSNLKEKHIMLTNNPYILINIYIYICTNRSMPRVQKNRVPIFKTVRLQWQRQE